MTTIADRFLAVHHLNLETLGVEPDLDPSPTTPAPARKAPKPFDQAGRDERALDLVGSRIVVGYGSTYFVQPSDPAANPYTVDLYASSCTCADHRFRVTRERIAGNLTACCKHITLARIHVADARAVAA